MADEADARERADDATDAERGSEDSDTRFADPEEIDRDDDEHHAEGALHAACAPNRVHQSRTGRFRLNSRAPPRSSCSTPTLERAARRSSTAEPATATNERNEAAAQAPKTAAGVDTASRARLRPA